MKDWVSPQSINIGSDCQNAVVHFILVQFWEGEISISGVEVQVDRYKQSFPLFVCIYEDKPLNPPSNFSDVESKSSIPPLYSLLILFNIFLCCVWQHIILYLVVYYWLRDIAEVSLYLYPQRDIKTHTFKVYRRILVAISAEESNISTYVPCFLFVLWVAAPVYLFQSFWCVFSVLFSYPLLIP